MEYLNNSSIESQKASYKGPLPIGKYIIYPKELSDPNIIMDLARIFKTRGDWGDWRVRLHNKNNENFDYYNRDNFFLHCGGKKGSAGCIDIGGGFLGNNENTEKIKKIIVNSTLNILVEVRK